MAAKPFDNRPSNIETTKLDCFIIIKIFFMNVLWIKWSNVAVWTSIRYPVQLSNGTENVRVSYVSRYRVSGYQTFTVVWYIWYLIQRVNITINGWLGHLPSLTSPACFAGSFGPIGYYMGLSKSVDVNIYSQ